MDGILQGLLQFGIGGIMAATVVWFAWYQSSRTIPALMSQAKEERDAVRIDFRQMIVEQRQNFIDALAQLENSGQQASESIIKRMEEMGRSLGAIIPRLEAMDRHTMANEAQLQAIRDAIIRMGATPSVIVTGPPGPTGQIGPQGPRGERGEKS